MRLEQEPHALQHDLPDPLLPLRPPRLRARRPRRDVRADMRDREARRLAQVYAGRGCAVRAEERTHERRRGGLAGRIRRRAARD